MGLFDQDEHTLFKPSEPAATAAAGAARRPVVDEEEPSSLRDLLESAWNASKRRRALSTMLLVVGGTVTAASSHYAPRAYRATGEVLVVSTNEQADPRRAQREWEHQIRSHESLVAVARDAHLEAADLARIDRSLFVTVDQNTVTVEAEWQDPVVARDLVQAALAHFVDRRYQTEVASSTTRIGPLEAQAETARLALAQVDPGHAPPPQAPAASLPTPAASAEVLAALRALPAAKERREAAAARLNALEADQRTRIDRLEAERTEKSRTMAPGHPEMTASLLQLARARVDTPSLVAARAEKAEADQRLADVAAAAKVPLPHARVVPPPAERALDELSLRRITAAQDDYARKKDALDEETLKLRVAEAAFHSKYQVTRPPELPLAPVKPIGTLVAVGGALATLLLMLAMATLRDRSAGLFFEARHVRDRLGLPVLGDLRQGDLLA